MRRALLYLGALGIASGTAMNLLLGQLKSDFFRAYLPPWIFVSYGVIALGGVVLVAGIIIGGGHSPAFEARRASRLTATLEGVLSGAIKAHVELARPQPIPARTRTLAVPPRVIVNNNASRTHTVIEVNGRDRPGLLFQVTRALTALNLQISSAKISTYGEKVVDVFYVKDIFGHKIEDETRLQNVREGLLGALADEPAQNPTVAAE